MKPISAFLLWICLVSAPQHALAQLDPANMVSGVDSLQSTSGVYTKTLFTVPAGHRFVFTDFSSFGIGAHFQIIDNNNRVRWYVPRHLVRNPTSTDPWETHASLATGLVFDSGHTVDLRITSSAFFVYFGWSGYLVPIATGGVPADNSQQLGFSLSPNPARQVVTLKFELARSADVNLGIYDAQGRRVRTVASGRLGAGAYVKTWDGRTEAGVSAPSGVYFARLESSEANSVRRLIRIR